MNHKSPVLDAISTRRSIRRYTGEPIEEAVLRDLLEAGFDAPSAMNRRPQHFVLVTDRAVMQAMSEASPYAKMLPGAAAAIVVCGDESVSGPFYMDDCAASTENILLAAHSLGLGAVWCGICHAPHQPAFEEILRLPEHIRAYSLIVLGHPAEEREAPDRYDGARVHRDRW